MRKKLFSILFFGSFFAKSQVGINTTSPSVTFEVHASSSADVADGIMPPKMTAEALRLKDHLYSEAQNGAMVYITSSSGKSTSKTKNVNSPGYYIYDSGSVNTDKSKGCWKKTFSDTYAYDAKAESGVNLAKSKTTLLGSEFRNLILNTIVDKGIGSENIKDDQYIVKESGLYFISYSLKFGEGVTSKKLNKKKPALVIAKTSSENTASTLDYKMLGGEVSNISLSQGSINHIYNLEEGDKINFGVSTGGNDLDALGEISADISVFKIR